MLRTTKSKVSIAHYFYKIIKLVKKDNFVKVSRKGINYSLDLSEGIDLSVFLFSGFQKHLFNKKLRINNNEAILDVGANCGVISLNYAKKYPSSVVYSFEPTDFAFSKMLTNISLNKDRINNIIPVKAFISSTDKDVSNLSIYSSWKVDNILGKNVHPTHRGSIKPASDVPTYKIDTFVNEHNIKKVGFIKIDTDGFELDVLSGAAETIVRDRPIIVFEVGLYLLDEKDISFETFIRYFADKKYKLHNPDFKKQITTNNYKSIIPQEYTIDVFALPEEYPLL